MVDMELAEKELVDMEKVEKALLDAEKAEKELVDIDKELVNVDKEPGTYSCGQRLHWLPLLFSFENLQKTSSHYYLSCQ